MKCSILNPLLFFVFASTILAQATTTTEVHIDIDTDEEAAFVKALGLANYTPD